MTIKMNQSRQKLGTKVGHQFFYFIIRLGGRRLAYFFLYFVVFYYVAFYPGIKTKTDPYLRRKFPDSGSLKRIVERYQYILQLGKILIDRAIYGICGEDSMRICFEKDEDLHRLQALSSGFIILMSHVGSWQVVMSALLTLGKPVNLLMLRDALDVDKHYFEHGNTEIPFNIISPDQFLGGTIDMLNVLKKDEILCIMGDRIYKNQELSVHTAFLGKEAGFPISAFKLASIVQKPVVVLYSQKTGSTLYTLTISEIMNVPARLGKKPETFLPYVKTFVASLEQYTDQYPYQFFNFYDMWKDDEITNDLS